MSSVLRFIAWLLGQVWRWGRWVIDIVIVWVRRNWQQVWGWIVAGWSFWDILMQILRWLGLI